MPPVNSTDRCNSIDRRRRGNPSCGPYNQNACRNNASQNSVSQTQAISRLQRGSIPPPLNTYPPNRTPPGPSPRPKRRSEIATQTLAVALLLASTARPSSANTSHASLHRYPLCYGWPPDMQIRARRRTPLLMPLGPEVIIIRHFVTE